MHPEIEKLIEMSLADGQVTAKEREIILRKAEKLGLDADVVEMYLEGKINSVKLETVVIEETSSKLTESKNKYEIKVFKSVIPAKLDNEKNLLDAIVKKENQKNLIYNNLIIAEQEYEIQLDFHKKTKAIEKENTIKLLETKQIEFDNFLNEFKKNYVLKTKNELKKNKKLNLKMIFIDNKNQKSNEDKKNIFLTNLGLRDKNYFLTLGERMEYVINNSEWYTLGNPILFYLSLFGLFFFLVIFLFSGMNNYYFLIFSLVFLLVSLFSTSSSLLRNISNTDSLTLKLRGILSTRLNDFFINYIEPDFVTEINKINKMKNEITEHQNKLDSLNKELFNFQTNFDTLRKSLDDEIFIIENEINKHNLSIKLEKELKKFPTQAIGSITLYNHLNKKQSLFVDSQFNKTIRFLEHIENKEKNYRDLYVECTNGYIIKPNNIPISELKKEEKEINDCYKLLLVLVTEVNGDKVKFNKVYNNLEDAGLFMTIPEKMNQKYLSDISTKLDNVIKGLEVIFESMEEANRALREIEENTGEISVNMYDVSNHLWDISYALYK